MTEARRLEAKGEDVKVHVPGTEAQDGERAYPGARLPHGGPVPPWRPPPGFVPLGSVPNGNASAQDATRAGELASWASRVAALVIDSIVVWAPGLMVWALFAAAKVGSLGELVVGAGGLLYFAALDGRGQTVGKRMVGIEVRDERSGQPIGFGRALGRWLIYSVLWYLLFVPGMVNALSPLWDRRHQAWHDRAVGSVVVRTQARDYRIGVIHASGESA